MNLIMITIIMIFSIPLAGVLGGILLAIIKMLKAAPSAEDRKLDEEEARMMQEIYKGLENMEKRVEALETIILERERKDRK